MLYLLCYILYLFCFVLARFSFSPSLDPYDTPIIFVQYPNDSASRLQRSSHSHSQDTIGYWSALIRRRGEIESNIGGG